MSDLRLSRGEVAIVDDADLVAVSVHVWHLDTQGYARTNIKQVGGWRLVRLHRFLLQPPPEYFVDHIDGDKMNNRRVNLRICTPAQSVRNTRSRCGSSSRFKGVSWNSRAGKWMAQIQVCGKNNYLGLFVSEFDAADVYRIAAKQLHGDFARLE